MGALILHFWYVWVVLALALIMGIVTLLLRDLNKMSADEMEILVKQPPMTSQEAQFVVKLFEQTSNNHKSENAVRRSKT